MTSDRWQLINELYHDALELDGNEQAPFLTQKCGGDVALRDEVESLLASHHKAGNFISEPGLTVAARIIASDQAKSPAGQCFSHYRIESLLGVGGMGQVYLALDTSLDRKVALKFLPPYFTNDAERLHRFEQEARAASALNHPNILTIYEIGQVDGNHYTATEFIEGETLREHMASQEMSLEESLNVATQIASALAAAHDAGIVHRDIKPENVMLRSDGLVKVLDFGLAKLPSGISSNGEPKKVGSPTATNQGIVMGTVRYMSPEQARGQEVDERTDIWSLGVVLYEMVTGRAPFAGETSSHVIVSVLESTPLPASNENRILKVLEPIIDKALRKDREERYLKVKDFWLDLKHLEREFQIEAHLGRAGSSEKSRVLTSEPLAGVRTVLNEDAILRVNSFRNRALAERFKRHRRGVLLAAATIIVFLATLAYFFYGKKRIEHSTSSGETIASLAVLPFVNETGDPNSEHLADGISDSVINSLSRLPNLRVISLNAVLRYKNKPTDARNVGRDLNVGAVLRGRMTQRGENLTVNAELVDVRDNRRLWGEEYHRKLSEILFVQDEIARNISEGLRLRLTGEEKKQLAKQYTDNTEAYLFYSLGRYASNKNTQEGLETAIKYYEQAIEIDSKYALAYVGLSSAYRELQSRGFWIPKEASQKREWAALKAVELDDTLSEAHVALAEAKLPWDPIAGEKECKRALELDPNSIDANQRYALFLAYSGRPDDAISYAKRADALDQTRSRKPAFLGFVYFMTRRYDEAIGEYQKAVEMFPGAAQPHFFLGEGYLTKGKNQEGVGELQKAVALDNAPERWDRMPMLAYAYGVSGRRDEALKILAEQKRVAKHRYISNYNFAIIYLGLADKDRAFEYLNKAIDEGTSLGQVPSRPMFDSLRSDPRYLILLRRLHRNSEVRSSALPRPHGAVSL